MIFSVLLKFIKGKKLIRGFTLIELMVVISIIAILTAAATISYANVQMKSRDGKRKADMAAIQQALEMFYADYGSYPNEGTNVRTADDNAWKEDQVSCEIDNSYAYQKGINAGTPFACPKALPTKTYMKTFPTDPVTGPSDLTTGRGYFYDQVEGFCKQDDHDHCQNYTLWTRLENLSDPDIAKTAADPICNDVKYSTNPDSDNAPADGLYDHLVMWGGNYCVHASDRYFY